LPLTGRAGLCKSRDVHARLTVLLLAVLGTACAHTDTRLWDAALGLDRPDRMTQAEETLNQAGAEGIEVLLRTPGAERADPVCWPSSSTPPPP